MRWLPPALVLVYTLFHRCRQLDSRCDVVNMRLDVLWEVVFVTAYAHGITAVVHMLVELC